MEYSLQFSIWTDSNDLILSCSKKKTKKLLGSVFAFWYIAVCMRLGCIYKMQRLILFILNSKNVEKRSLGRRLSRCSNEERLQRPLIPNAVTAKLITITQTGTTLIIVVNAAHVVLFFFFIACTEWVFNLAVNPFVENKASTSTCSSKYLSIFMQISLMTLKLKIYLFWGAHFSVF